MTDQIKITLSHDELLYILQVLRLPTLPGLPSDLMDNLTVDAYQQLLGSAERSLNARGYIQIENERLVVESALVGIIGFCAGAPNTVRLVRTDLSGNSVGVVYHFSQTLKIKHHTNRGVHYFTFLPDNETAIKDMAQEMRGNASVASHLKPPLALHIPAAALLIASVTRLQAINEKALVEGLAKNGLTVQDAQAIIQILRYEVIASVSVGIWQLPHEAIQEPKEENFGLLFTQQGWYALHSVAGENEKTLYYMEPLATNELGMVLQERFAAYLAAPLVIHS